MTDPNAPSVDDVIERAAEIAADEGHPGAISGDNVTQAFEETK